jgi:hypothetical protein
MTSNLKKIVSITFLLVFAFKVFAPSSESLVIIDTPPVEPFNRLIHAIGMVETRYDTLAYNPVEKAVGYFQIRPIRVEDYNKRTGSNYTMKDMFDYKNSEKIFLYYASLIGPYNFEKIAMNWNGSGPRTINYWKRVKKYL